MPTSHTDHQVGVLSGDACLRHDRRQRDLGDGEVLADANDDEGAPREDAGIEAGKSGVVGRFRASIFVCLLSPPCRDSHFR
jgi:hypothetical protein